MSKPILCLDFDGVLHSYASGWKGADVIPDPPVQGGIEALKAYTERFLVAIHSARFNWVNNPREGPGYREWNATTRLQDPPFPTPQHAVEAWLVEWGIPAGWIVRYADRHLWSTELRQPGQRIFLVETKPPALVTLDDRGITFDGTFPDAETLLAFRPWNEQAI